jgi:hypothetical protein
LVAVVSELKLKYRAHQLAKGLDHHRLLRQMGRGRLVHNWRQGSSLHLLNPSEVGRFCPLRIHIHRGRLHPLRRCMKSRQKSPASV